MIRDPNAIYPSKMGQWAHPKVEIKNVFGNSKDKKGKGYFLRLEYSVKTEASIVGTKEAFCYVGS
jgi:hypothetical protein